MDITSQNFWQTLPDILKEIATSHYVAVDFEMSGGIPRQGRHFQQQQDLSAEEAAFATARQGATMHNLVQFGMTLIKYNDDGYYETKSFTFDINNMFLEDNKEGWDFSKHQDRVLDFSNSALKFFRIQGVDPVSVEAVADYYHARGVPYLSRQEHREALEFVNRAVSIRKTVEAELDDRAREFRDEASKKILQWLEVADKERNDFLIITFSTDSVSRSDLYLRIVNHIVSSTCPHYDVVPVNAKRAARIRPRNEDFEAQRHEKRLRDLNIVVNRQIGLSIIIEALAGGDFVHLINPDLILGTGRSSPTSKDAEVERESDDQHQHQNQHPNKRDLRQEKLINTLRGYEADLKTRTPVLVGHNFLFDLCFLYDTFIGALPKNLDGFRDAISRLFPRIIDTKVLAVQDDPVEGGDPLGDLFARSKVGCPGICTDHGFGFGIKAVPHNAGYDSYMTAVVFLALCHKRADSEGGLPYWDDLFWDGCRTLIRFGPGTVTSLDASASKPGVCFVL